MVDSTVKQLPRGSVHQPPMPASQLAVHCCSAAITSHQVTYKLPLDKHAEAGFHFSQPHCKFIVALQACLLSRERWGGGGGGGQAINFSSDVNPGQASADSPAHGCCAKVVVVSLDGQHGAQDLIARLPPLGDEGPICNLLSHEVVKLHTVSQSMSFSMQRGGRGLEQT